MALKRRARVLSALEEIAALRFDDHAVRTERRAPVVGREVGDQPFPVQRSLYADVFQCVRLSLQVPEGAGDR